MPSLPTRPDAYAFFLTLVSIGICGALLIMSKTVPSEMWLLTGAGAGASAGINVQNP